MRKRCRLWKSICYEIITIYTSMQIHFLPQSWGVSLPIYSGYQSREGIIHWLLRSTVYGFIKDRVIDNKFWNCILEQKSRISTALLLFALKVQWKNWFTHFTVAQVRKVYTRNISKKLCFVRFTLCVSCNHAYSLTCLFYYEQ